MAAITGAVLGAASIGYGLYSSFEGKKKSAAGYAEAERGAMIQAEAARLRAGISKEQAASSVEFAGRNLGLEQEAAGQSVTAAAESRRIQQDTIRAELRNEEERRKAMELEGRRKQLEIIRNQQRARAMGLVTATAQGAARGSGIQGGYGAISGQTGVNILGVQQNLEIGRDIFTNNAQISQNRIAHSDLEFMYAQQRAAQQTARSQMAYEYAQANAGFQTRLADTETLMSMGGGVTSRGMGMVGMGGAESAFGSTLIGLGPSMFGIGMKGADIFGGPRSPYLGGLGVKLGGLY